MGMLIYGQILELIQEGVIENVELSAIQGSSLDLSMSNIVRLERRSQGNVVDLANSESPIMSQVNLNNLDAAYIDIEPQSFILAETEQRFNLPADITATYCLNSTLARSGLGHALAGHVDPFFNNAPLTLELYNMLQFQKLRLTVGMRCGQIVFHRHLPVPEHQGYGVKGRYNGQSGAQGAKIKTTQTTSK